MSVSTTATSQSFTSTGGTTYPITAFSFFDSTELLVVKKSGGVSTTLVLGTDYSVTGGAGSTGNVTTTTAIPSGVTLIVSRVTSKTQLTSYTTGDRFPASAQERALDRLTMIAQENGQNSIPNTTSTSGSAPFVLGISDAGGTPYWVSQTASAIADGSITASKLSTGHPIWDASGNLTATSFVGNINGAVTATTGSFSGALTASGGITGNLTGTASAIADGAVSTTAKLADGIVTKAKLGTNEQKQICKAWVNFDGSTSSTWAGGASTVSRTAGSTTATITTTNSHGLVTGNFVWALTGVVAGSYTVTVLTATTFTITTVATTALTAAAITFQGSTIRSSYNVSSVAKIATGEYICNFQTPMSDTFYAVASAVDNSSGNVYAIRTLDGSTPRTANYVRLQSLNLSGVQQEAGLGQIVVFGN
jgi:hypothetical protein